MLLLGKLLPNHSNCSPTAECILTMGHDLTSMVGICLSQTRDDANFLNMQHCPLFSLHGITLKPKYCPTSHVS